MTKQKVFKDKARIQSNSGKLTNWLTSGTSDEPVVINDESVGPIVIREEEDEGSINLADIPQADSPAKQSSRSTRRNLMRGNADQDSISNASDSGDSALFVPQLDDQTNKIIGQQSHVGQDEDTLNAQEDDKKKFGLKTSYDGFSIYGRILCLIVKRRGTRTQVGGGGTHSNPSQTMLENWVSTQAAGDNEDAG